MACLVNLAAPCSAELESFRGSTSEISLMSSTPSSSCNSSAQDLCTISGECDNRPDTASSGLPDGGELASGPSECGQRTVRVSLHEEDLWKEFQIAGNEMILTKTGRRMFPFIMVTPTGLKPSALYTITLRVVCADNFKYKYTDRRWHTVGTSDVMHDRSRMAYKHPSTPAPGEQLNNKPVDFKAMKITHFSKSKNGNILLHTMHKYFVEVCIDETYGEGADPHIDAVERASAVFEFPVTTFITVTSYLSPKLTELKVKHNPFARGFKNKPTMCADFSYPDQIIEQNLIPTVAANQLPLIFPPPNAQDLPIRPLPPLIPPFPHPTPVRYYYYPDPYDYPVSTQQ